MVFQNRGYMSRSEVKRVMEAGMNVEIDIISRRIIIFIANETIEEAFGDCLDEQRKGVKTLIRNVMETALINIV